MIGERTTRLDALAAEQAFSRTQGRLARAFLDRPRLGRSGLKTDIYYSSDRISFAQINPFAFYAPELRRRFGAELRFRPVEPLLAGTSTSGRNAEVVLFQTWFTVDPKRLQTALQRIRDANPRAVIAFVDGFAHNDIRLARFVSEHIDFYLKKSLFKDQSQYFLSFEGDTNLTQFYGRLFGIDQTPTDWQTPPSILPKLKLSPNFFTAPTLLKRFLQDAPRLDGDRPIDLHARLATRGNPSYAAMRRAAMEAAKSLKGLNVPTETGIPWKRYLQEMGRSKLCFSPFGYGELCWRDIEAFLSGAVLVKPDMSHLSTLPNLYEPRETYLPVAWDFSNLEEVVREALADDALRERLAIAAFDRVADYLRKGNFVNDMADLFDRADMLRGRTAE
ncbi:MAG: glycosyltransferase family 1 protein [Pseudomonadota bacterium]